MNRANQCIFKRPESVYGIETVPFLISFAVLYACHGWIEFELNLNFVLWEFLGAVILIYIFMYDYNIYVSRLFWPKIDQSWTYTDSEFTYELARKANDEHERDPLRTL